MINYPTVSTLSTHLPLQNTPKAPSQGSIIHLRPSHLNPPPPPPQLWGCLAILCNTLLSLA